jgi:hypothetical protein
MQCRYQTPPCVPERVFAEAITLIDGLGAYFLYYYYVIFYIIIMLLHIRVLFIIIDNNCIK